MKKWANDLNQNMQRDEARRNQIQTVLPVEAKQFWDALGEMLKKDAQELSDTFGDKVGRIEFTSESANVLTIQRTEGRGQRAEDTDYKATLTFEKDVPAIKIERVGVQRAHAHASSSPTRISFNLDDDGKLKAWLSESPGSSRSTDDDFLSEFLLRPFVRGAENISPQRH